MWLAFSKLRIQGYNIDFINSFKRALVCYERGKHKELLEHILSRVKKEKKNRKRKTKRKKAFEWFFFPNAEPRDESMKE